MTNVDFLWQLADYLDRENIGDVTSNIFVGFYPDDPDNIIALLYNTGGQPNIDVADFEYPRFQVVIRNTDYVTGAGKLREIRRLLHDKLNVTTENFIALYIQADSEGGSIGKDGKGRFEFSINFASQIRSDSIS